VMRAFRFASATRKELQALRKSEARLRRLMENVPAVVYIAGPGEDGRWHYVSTQIEKLLGFTSEEWMGDSGLWYRQIHPDDRDRVMLDEETEWAEGPSDSQAIEYRMLTKDGRVVWVSDESYLILGDDDRPLYWSGFVLDITERKALEEQLAHQAFHDPLTRLANRALFTDRVEHASSRTNRRSATIAIVFLDLDDFKTINDSLGHDAGDQLLKDVAAYLQECLRAGDTASRFGGDEFAVLLEDASDVDDAVALVDRITARFEMPLFVGGKGVRVHASFGVALSDGADQGADDLIRNADAAMYVAKRKGKNRFEIFEPGMHTAALWRLEVKGDLQRALEDREFVVHYQPIVDLQARGSGVTRAMGPSQQGPGAARRLHSPGGGERSDRGDRHVGLGRGMPRSHDVAARIPVRPPSFDVGECIREATPTSRCRVDDRNRANRIRSRARASGIGGNGERSGGRCRRGDYEATSPEGNRFAGGGG
jgi:diguanylate cyclase (GGDEF)-like protein/PAS domain S-box-containing protein